MIVTSYRRTTECAVHQLTAQPSTRAAVEPVTLVRRALLASATELSTALQTVQPTDRRRHKALDRWFAGFAAQIRRHHELIDTLVVPTLAARGALDERSARHARRRPRWIDELLGDLGDALGVLSFGLGAERGGSARRPTWPPPCDHVLDGQLRREERAAHPARAPLARRRRAGRPALRDRPRRGDRPDALLAGLALRPHRRRRARVARPVHPDDRAACAGARAAAPTSAPPSPRSAGAGALPRSTSNRTITYAVGAADGEPHAVRVRVQAAARRLRRADRRRAAASSTPDEAVAAADELGLPGRRQAQRRRHRPQDRARPRPPRPRRRRRRAPRRRRAARRGHARRRRRRRARRADGPRQPRADRRRAARPAVRPDRDARRRRHPRRGRRRRRVPPGAGRRRRRPTR